MLSGSTRGATYFEADLCVYKSEREKELLTRLKRHVCHDRDVGICCQFLSVRALFTRPLFRDGSCKLTYYDSYTVPDAQRGGRIISRLSVRIFVRLGRALRKAGKVAYTESREHSPDAKMNPTHDGHRDRPAAVRRTPPSGRAQHRPA